MAGSVQFGRRGPSPLPKEKEHVSTALENSNGGVLLCRQLSNEEPMFSAGGGTLSGFRVVLPSYPG
jgi:hypothetical protein